MAHSGRARVTAGSRLKPPSRSSAGANPAFLADVLDGLGRQPKTLPAKYFYDLEGSRLFEEITRLPEYYPTRTELGILDASGPEIGSLCPPGATLVEFGSGSTAKFRRLLPHLPRLSAYVPVDVSADFLGAEAERLRADYPDLRVLPVEADFSRPFRLPAGIGEKPLVGFFPGSTIGNFEPEDAGLLLARFRDLLGPDAVLIVGVDLVKDVGVLEAAYDDAQGVTAQFTLNMLRRINRELGADFDLDGFSHRAVYNARLSRIEMHLVSRRAQTAQVRGQPIHFAAGESIHTESSYKYTTDRFEELAAHAGWPRARMFTDPRRLFAVFALQPR